MSAVHGGRLADADEQASGPSSALHLVRRPSGAPVADDFELRRKTVAEPLDGEVVVAVEMVSLDPAMRGWMDDADSYMPPVPLGSVMRAVAGGRVLASRHPGIAEGDRVTGLLGLRERAVVDGAAVMKVDTDLSMEHALGVLGGAGLTAYFGLFDVGAARAGETVVVSGAAGAVGSVAGQLARIAGCRVIGIAGGARKGAFVVDELGFDAAIDYRTQDVGEALAELAPDGVDVYFDNVGGPILDAVLENLAFGARIAVCGAISQYNANGDAYGVRNTWQLLVRRATMRGFLLGDFAARFPVARRRLAQWVDAGRIRALHEIVDGPLEAFPDTFARLFEGQNMGKLLLRLVDA